MAFLDNDEGDARLVVGLEFDARLANGRQFVLQDLRFRRNQTERIVKCGTVSSGRGPLTVLNWPSLTPSR